jgi:hypothetical protein
MLLTPSFALLAVVVLSSHLCRVAAYQSVESEIDHLANATGQNITGLHKTTALRQCLQASNCAVSRLGNSGWRTRLVVTPEMRHRHRHTKEVEKRQCLAQDSTANTTISGGTTVLNYGTINPVDVFQSVSAACGLYGCDSSQSIKHSTYTAQSGSWPATSYLEVSADADYPDPDHRDAMMAAAGNTINQFTSPQQQKWYQCIVGGHGGGGCYPQYISQNYALDSIGVDIYNYADPDAPSLVARLHITVTAKPGIGSSLACDATVFNVYNIIKNLTNSWLFMLGNIAFLCEFIGQ